MDFFTRRTRFTKTCDTGLSIGSWRIKRSESEMPSVIEEGRRGYSRTQWILFGILGIVNLLAGLVYSIQAPFYPKEAQKKGASSTEFGLVLGIYELTNFFAAPVFGSHMKKLGPLRTFHVGAALCGIVTIVFGFLDKVEGHVPFIALSFLLRIPQAIGATGIITSSLTIVTMEFGNAVSTTFAAMETFFGVGFCVGPFVGEAFFEIGGFLLPFAALGGLLLISAPISALILCQHSIVKPRSGHEPMVTDKSGLISLLKIPSIHFSTFAIISTAISLGFLSAVLEPHLRQFNLSPLITGLMFLLFGGVYAVTAPAWGYICDKIKQPKYVTLVGAILIFTAFMLIGPVDFIPAEPTIWMTSAGLVTFGLGLGAIFVSSFIIALSDARMNGFPNDLATHALISGVWRSSVALGAFIGPTIAGALYDAIGFRKESLFIIGLQSVLIIIGIYFLVFYGKQNATPAELAPILDFSDSGNNRRRHSTTSSSRSSASNA